MKFSDETLMAYADGELDAETRAAVEAAMQEDPQIATIVERHRRLQSDLRAAFDGVLTETLPEHLINTALTARATTAAPVGDIAQARAARETAAQRRWSWREWGAIAASVLIGVVIARMPWGRTGADSIVAGNDRVIAGGALSSALTGQASGTRVASSPVLIGLSYRDKSGNYCRTFTINEGAALSGIACREGDTWRVQALVHGPAATSNGNYRMAGTAVPPLILQTVQDSIEGDALDAEAEAAARQRGWKPAP
ncbi:MAG TPA: hypothetical protein VKB34_09090 [Povalibacter sp.]|nr:hypothetical protein [Povalibacter sp.]